MKKNSNNNFFFGLCALQKYCSQKQQRRKGATHIVPVIGAWHILVGPRMLTGTMTSAERH